MLKEMSFQLLRECSGEWYHEASLTSRSQTSGRDVDSF